MIDDPVFSLEDKYFLDREEAFDVSMKKSVHYVKLCKKINLDSIEKQMFKKYVNKLKGVYCYFM